jgi:hypothetical protein
MPKTGAVGGALRVIRLEEPLGASDARSPKDARPARPLDELQLRAPALGDLAGNWRKVSGEGPERLVISVEQGSVQVLQPGGRRVSNIHQINGEPLVAPVWKGSFAAPGGTVRQVTTSTFEDGRLEQASRRTESVGLFGGFIATQLVERESYQLNGGRLSMSHTAGMYNRKLLWAGPFDLPMKVNTSNIGGFYRGSGRSEYIRE